MTDPHAALVAAVARGVASVPKPRGKLERWLVG